jgi:Bacterial SH3 domain
MRWLLGAGLVLVLCLPVSAGELVFVNGSRLAGELSNEGLMLSTGSGLVEIASDEVVTLSRDEIRLQDGRVIRGTLVGGQIKAKTTLGEIAVKVDELQSYRAEGGGPGAVSTAAAAQPSATTNGTSSAPAAPPGASTAASGAISSGLPTMSAYQDGSTARQGNGQTVVLTREASPTSSPNRVLEVLGSSVVYRDALTSSSHVGQVAAGQQVRYVDSIDRRLRILNLLVFDGGYWIKVRLTDGTEGWVPADTVREVR